MKTLSAFIMVMITFQSILKARVCTALISLQHHHHNTRSVIHDVVDNFIFQKSRTSSYTSRCQSNVYPTSLFLRSSSTYFDHVKRNNQSLLKQNEQHFNNSIENDIDDVLNTTTTDCISEQTISLLAQNKQTWRRLSDIIDLSSSMSSTSSSINQKSIVDIGCDHGMLAIALAISGRYDKVIGVDVSPLALDNALSFHSKVSNMIHEQEKHGHQKMIDEKIELPLEFRLGDGLEALLPGEADAICIAGMGIESMISILGNQVKRPQQRRDDTDMASDTSQYINHLDYLNCKTLYLQSPKNRPKYLMSLYFHLQKNNWILVDERICSLKNRWYITSSFERKNNDENCCTKGEKKQFLLPGHFLALDNKDPSDFINYVRHHLKWMDGELKNSLTEDELLWKQTFMKLIET